MYIAIIIRTANKIERDKNFLTIALNDQHI